MTNRYTVSEYTGYIKRRKEGLGDIRKIKAVHKPKERSKQARKGTEQTIRNGDTSSSR